MLWLFPQYPATAYAAPNCILEDILEGIIEIKLMKTTTWSNGSWSEKWLCISNQGLILSYILLYCIAREL